MTATVCCIHTNGMIKLLEKHSSKSTNAFQWAMETRYEMVSNGVYAQPRWCRMECMRNRDGKMFRRRSAR